MGLICGYVHAGGLLSKEIEWFGGGYYSHSTTLLPSDHTKVIDSRSDVQMGVAAGVQIRPVEYLKQWPCVWLEVPATDAQLQKLEALGRSQIGKPYDFHAIADFADGSNEDPNWRDLSAWICSELHVWMEEGAEIIPHMGAPLFRIPPGGAYLIDRARGGNPYTLS